jgi:hypothetical protein
MDKRDETCSRRTAVRKMPQYLLAVREVDPRYPQVASFLKLNCEKADPEINTRSDEECYADGSGGMPSDLAPVHRSSRRPLKNGWCSLPSADFARYSISAISEGSTHTPR